jgi:hypothetical protein
LPNLLEERGDQLATLDRVLLCLPELAEVFEERFCAIEGASHRRLGAL